MGMEALSVTAMTSSQADFIPSVDTMTAQVTWQHRDASSDHSRNISGVMAVTYECQSLRYEMEVVGSDGTAVLSRGWTANMDGRS